MNLFIHYRGTFTPDANIDPLLDFVRTYALQKNWDTLEWEETGKMWAAKESEKDSFHPSLATVSQKGVIINIDNGRLFVPIIVEKPMQSLVQFFPGPGEAWIATNNCFIAIDEISIDTHIALCTLFHEIQKQFIPTLEVWDEGEYFETKNRKRLEKNRKRNMRKPPNKTVLDEIRSVIAQTENLKNPFDNDKRPN